MDDQQRATFEQELRQFSGSETIYKHNLSRGTYTEGVRHVAQELGAYWLLDYIFSVQFSTEVVGQEFQVWKLKTGDESEATLILEDGNDNELKRFEISYTDFPLKEMTFWLVNNILLLPREY